MLCEDGNCWRRPTRPTRAARQCPGAIFVAHAAFFENSSADSQFPPPSVRSFGPSVRPSVRPSASNRRRTTTQWDSHRRKTVFPFSPVECVRARACPVRRPSAVGRATPALLTTNRASGGGGGVCGIGGPGGLTKLPAERTRTVQDERIQTV